jgi:prepilin-type N-terminal cleavage/methylation domain-containing protein
MKKLFLEMLCRDNALVRRGVSLIEVLVVVAIIALLAALLLPVILNARKRGYEPVCLSNLRQLHVAFAAYLQDYNVEPPKQRYLWAYLKDYRVLNCPADMTEDGAETITANPPFTPAEQRVRTSYLYYRDERTFFLEDELIELLKSRDPNHGIFVCYLHGEPADPPVLVPLHDMKGKVLRLRLDGSISPVQVEHVCMERHGVVYGYRLGWHLFTDVRPAPPEALRPPPLDVGTPIECPPRYR